VLKRSFRFADEPFFYLVIYEFEQGTCVGKCTGSCVLRFNDDDPRIQDKSQKALQRVKITPDDVWCRDKDTGIFGQIDKFHQMLKSKPEQNWNSSYDRIEAKTLHCYYEKPSVIYIYSSLKAIYCIIKRIWKSLFNFLVNVISKLKFFYIGKS